MPYDLYGTYYAREADAINAEMAQCAEINNRYMQKDIDNLKRQMHEQQPTQDYEMYQKVDFLMSKVEELEKRVAQLESRQ